jgi:hypothetical protein
MGNLLAKLWKSVGIHDNGSLDTTATVGGFMDTISSPTFRDTFNLIVHKIDKKKEKALSFAYKQALMDSLKAETNLLKLCPLVLSLAIYQLTNSVLELPSDLMTAPVTPGTTDYHFSHPVVSFVLAWIRPPRLSVEDFSVIEALLASAAQEGTGLSAADAVTIAEAAKVAVLKKPTAS